MIGEPENMSIRYIEEYHRKIRNLRKVSGSSNESVLRSAFQECLTQYCAQNFTLVAELPYSSEVIPDGTIKDSLRLAWGYWEAKDQKDDIDKEIDRKIRRGYPTSNILFENSKIAVLIQDGEDVGRVNMADAKALDLLITRFLAYEPPAITDFRKAIRQFKEDLPNVLVALREMIEQSYKERPEFRKVAKKFLELCKEAINPDVESADVREMLIQHILTKDIFLKVFVEDQFHKENNIANRLDGLEETFFTGGTKREMVDRLKGYYSAITVTAASIDSHREKQKFLKAVYEDFYKVYNPNAADRLGVVYTPNEIVDFMINAADELVHKHFGKRLYDKNVQILDPAVGTGTFITDLIEFIPNAHIDYKYENEIHANEVGILPYYIANLNIEYTYKQKTGKYKEFPNICFVDTLDNLAFKGKGQQDLIGALTYENLARVKRQNEEDISVIIGNPPYNANQRNESDNNKNREYPGVDKRIKSTYIRQSSAQKTKQYDMYKRFIRWASDRLGENGVLAFITNRSWLDSRQDDGFRKAAFREFSEIYAVDLGGDIRKNPGAGNVFGIMTGVAIGLFVRRKGAKKCDIYYAKCNDFASAREKLAFLSSTGFLSVDFKHIVPNENGNWIHQSDNGFDQLIYIANKRTKAAKAERTLDENAVFKLYSLGVVTNRDEWVYDFSKEDLHKKIRFFIKSYEETRSKYGGREVDAEKLGTKIKWTRDLKKHLIKNRKVNFNAARSRISLFRPFVKKYIYFSQNLNETQYQTPKIFPFGKKDENKVICFNVDGKGLYVLASNILPDLHFTGDSQCLPLYRYEKRRYRYNNITGYGRKQFWTHYKTKKITNEDIFHYTYAVLHNPAYLEKYAVNLKDEFPRLPLYKDFYKWAKWGEELMDLHINFEKQKPYPLERIDKDCKAGDAKLKADKSRGTITIDAQTRLAKIPPEAWKYKLGNRCALEWVLDQYKEKKPQDLTIKEEFNTYKFAAHKEKVIDLLGRVCTVSVETVKIVGKMKHNQKHE